MFAFSNWFGEPFDFSMSSFFKFFQFDKIKFLTVLFSK